MTLTRRQFAIATTAIAATAVLGCDGQASTQTPPADAQPLGKKKKNKANLAKEPFLIGPLSRFTEPGLYEDFKKTKGVWVISDSRTLVVLSATCTHLGCSTKWLQDQSLFKCPCHGSRFDLQGANLRGSKAKRPLERCALSIVSTDTGDQVQVDPTRRFRQEKGQWSDPASSLPL